MLSRALALIWVAVLLIPAAAGAQEPTPEELAEARIHFERARGFEEAGDYERAADEYLSAYALYPDPEFFFNVGRVHRSAGNLERALHYFERYLKLDPHGRGAEAAQTEVEALRDELGDEGPVDEPEGDDGGEGDGPDEEPKSEPPDVASEDLDPLEPSDGGAMPGDEGTSGGGLSGLQIAGIATGGVGVAALGASAFFGNRARGLSNDISAFVDTDPDSWNDTMIGKYRQGQRANRRMYILGGVGVAAATTGAILFVMGRDDASAESPGVAVSPVFTPHGAALALGGSF